MSIYERVKALADEKNLSIRKLEIKINTYNGAISKLKTNPDYIPSDKIVTKLCNYLHTTREYILNGDESMKHVPDTVITLPTYNEFETLIIETYRECSPEEKMRIISFVNDIYLKHHPDTLRDNE